MTHIKKINEFFASKPPRKESLPHCSDMEGKGYRIAWFHNNDENRYAFDKNFEVDDEVYWLGYDTNDYKYGQKYNATEEMVTNKKTPFYNFYCKCDPSPNDKEVQMIKDREKEVAKRHKEFTKRITSPPPKKKQKK